MNRYMRSICIVIFLSFFIGQLKAQDTLRLTLDEAVALARQQSPQAVAARLLTLTIPQDVKDITVNLKAPFVINSDTQKGCQIIAENEDYEIKYKIYDILQEKNASESESVKKGEN